ncbi:MAG: M48 family metalloprotease [Acidobacteriota bacterium]|nr:MAG: M48 family metalloprotease [Acidobacteriota bacterium]
MSGRKLLAAVLILALFPLPCLAAGKGVYEAVELKEREKSLIETVNEYENLFVRRGYRYDTDELNALIRGIAERLAPEPTDPYIDYRFYVFRNPIPNAFALPDGQVYLHTGMLAVLENEAQLAGLLAHEINHSAGHHSVLSFRSARKKVITSMVLGPLTLGLSDIFLILSMLGYSRDLEEEADRRGFEQALDLGYDVREMARFFEILNRDPEGERIRVKTKWSTHPQLQDRADYIRGMVAEREEGVNFGELKVEAKSYRSVTREVALLTVEDLARADYPRSALYLAKRLVEEDDTEAEAHFLLGEALRALGGRGEISLQEEPTKKEKRKTRIERVVLTRGEREEKRLETEEGRENLRRNLDAAQSAYRRALELDASLAEAHRGLGFALEGLGLYKEAGKELVKYLRARPEALDKEIVMERLKSITENLKKEGEEENASP